MKFLAIPILLSTSLNFCSLFGGQSHQPIESTPSTPAPVELSPAAECRGKYTPTYRTLWVPAVGSQIPEYEGTCLVSSSPIG